ncbi:exocyst complex subunit Sec15-like-domain-containing protein [Globomyces pollinis-pini]|nr:exocyst complex subunit Sec15-like-domain-containing protein [Globomyces pollinis-pini]
MEATLTKEEKAHLNQLVRDLVQGDANLPSGSDSNDGFDQIPYIVKQVYQAGREEAFSDHLSVFISKKAIEIEKVCSLHYQEFVQSVDQLLKVRVGTASINDKLNNMNNDVQSFGSKLLDKKKELIENRQKLLNVELTLEAVQSCLFVLDISNKISTHITNKKYFSALRMIQELQAAHLRLVRGYSFSKQIINWLPEVQETIRDAVMRDLKEWFIIVKTGAHKIGKLALELTNIRQTKANELLASKSSLCASSHSLNLHASVEMAVNEEYDLDALDTDSAQLDFTPLFQCIHIHEVLGKRAQLKLEFDESRKLQCELILKSDVSLKSGHLDALERYIQEVAGFFVIEATVIGTTQDFRSKSSVDTLWETSTNLMNKHLFEALSECTNPDLFLTIKMMVNSFIQTMDIYGYQVGSLTELMVSLLDRYAELMKSRCNEIISKVIHEDDDYSPMTLRDNEELEEILKSVRIPEDVLKPAMASSKWDSSNTFPKTLPFSKGLPLICQCIRNLIIGFYKFADGFSQKNHEIDDLLKKMLENLLIQINGAFVDHINSSGLSVVLQIMTNMQFFTHACTEYEQMLQERRFVIRSMKVTLNATRSFQDTRVAAENKIFSIIKSKCDSFLELIDYDWKLAAPRRQASQFLSDLNTFLSTVLSSTLADLPVKSKNKMYFETFSHLAERIKDSMLDSSVTQITLSALETVEYDVLFLEQCCRKIQDTQAQDSFIELKQLIAYGKSEKYDEYLNTATRSKKYARVTAEDAVSLLEKLANIDTSWFSKATPFEKQLKVTIDNVLVKLRTMH